MSTNENINPVATRVSSPFKNRLKVYSGLFAAMRSAGVAMNNFLCEFKRMFKFHFN